MGLSIKSIQENWNKKTTAQKVGTVAGTVVAGAAVAVGTASAIRAGKLSKLAKYSQDGDKFVKLEDAAKDAKFTEKVKGLWTKFTDGFKSVFTKDGRKAWNGVEAKDGQAAVKGQKEVYAKLKDQLKAEKAAAKAAKKAEKTEQQAPAEAPGNEGTPAGDAQ